LPPTKLNGAWSDEFVHGSSGQLMVVQHGRFGTAPLEVVTSRKKVVNVARDYDAARLRPTYANFEGRSLFHITAEEE
jgi:6-phosphofructokinase 1